jgi:hypothetical protein
MKKVVLLFLLSMSISSFSQNSKFKLELNYPIPVDQNFIGKNYSGIIDLGLKYSVQTKDIINLGIAFNTGLLTFDNTKNVFFENYKTNAYFIQPKVFCEFNLKTIQKLHPYTSLGYSFILFKSTGTNNEVDLSGTNNTSSGINLNLGLAIDITKKLFVNVQYDFIKLKKDDLIPNSTFNTNINLVKFGVGLKL